MLVGHTKFSPDWCFGLFKQRYRRTFVSCLDDVAKVVGISADVNVAQLVGTQSGEPVVPMYNWATFLGGHFRTVPQLKQHQHFMFSSQHPGVVTMKQFSDSASTTFSMLVDHEWHPTALELPPRAPASHLPRWPLLHQAVVPVQTNSCLLQRGYSRSNLPEAVNTSPRR